MNGFELEKIQNDSPESKPDSNKARLLVLDDDPIFLQLLSRILQSRGYVVEQLTDADTLAAVLQRFKPHIILIDVNLGDVSGIDLLPMVRSLSPDTDVIMLSATRTPEIVFHALFEGATDFIEKPVIAPEVDLRIRTILKKQDLRKKMQIKRAELEKERNLLMRYFSKEVAENIMNGRLTSDLRGESLDITTMFFSIKDAGKILRTMDPASFGEFLNETLVDVMDLVHDSRGSVSKVSSAGILATFGLPAPSSRDAANALSCAQRIRQHFQTLNDAGIYEFGRLRIGIGITSGLVFAGSIGSFQRMEFTLIGDNVNVASRLETLAGSERGEILTDSGTIERSGISDARELPDTTVRGRKGEIRIFAI